MDAPRFRLIAAYAPDSLVATAMTQEEEEEIV